MICSYVLYYGKFVFIFYICSILLRFLRTGVNGAVLWLLLFVFCVAVTHLLNIISFKVADLLIGLENTTLSFEMLGRMFLSDSPKDITTKVSLVIFNLQDMQLLILPVGLKMVKYGMRYQKARQDLETQRVKKELDHLKSQLGPHFILNILSSAYVKIQDVSKESASYLGKLADIIHYSLYETNQDMISLEREINCFKNLVDLESGRQQSRVMLSIEQHGTVKPSYRIPSLLLMTLAENAFKHGIKNDSYPSRLDVKIQIENDKLDFFIENSKSHQEESPKIKPSGIGLQNILRRLQLHFNKDFVFHINETANVYSVNVVIPIALKDPLNGL
ncbi:sensor histidine kinase [Dyadobacter sp. CY312]|uniref:sensor histidine kinase n=1 Tax=Dyadobacter sp. CY312 TaxID=2907303 RepID=UPI001F39787A|nr:histidine kinase [Dyadobacter sp. CY312]MCE7044467.1 histidine kinase [Dyadobacter sp. CY312]